MNSTDCMSNILFSFIVSKEEKKKEMGAFNSFFNITNKNFIHVTSS